MHRPLGPSQGSSSLWCLSWQQLDQKALF